MPNQMDDRFSKRKSYNLAGVGFNVKVNCNGAVWHAVIRKASGETSGISFADENACLTYLRNLNQGRKLSFVADPAAVKPVPAFMDVEGAKAEMQATNPRKFDPHSNIATSEPQPKSFVLTEEQIQAVNEGILASYCDRHAESFNSVSYNVAVLARAIDDISAEQGGGLVLNDALIASTIAQLEAANMLVPRNPKRGSTQVQPYRRLSEQAAANAQQAKMDEDAEARRRRGLSLDEQAVLLSDDNPNLKLQGSTVNRSASSTTQTTTRGRVISDEEKDIRAKLHSGELSFEDLQKMEQSRQAEVRRGKR